MTPTLREKTQTFRTRKYNRAEARTKPRSGAILPFAFLFTLLLGFAAGAKAGELSLWSDPVGKTFRQTPAPVSIPLGANAVILGKAGEIPVSVAAVGSGIDIHVSLVLTDSQAEVTQAEMARCVMAAALTLHQVSKNSGKDRAARASLYHAFSPISNDFNVKLAEAIFLPAANNPRTFAFPGPAWKRVAAVERNFTETEANYLMVLQSQGREWGIDTEDREAARERLTPAQDAAISQEVNIHPGSINMAPLLMKPLVP
ncbi:MAG: hypothetical protein LBJ14_02850 [Desulfarculales bacterium]|jgi:hypothetical protein|nr:hypothetical protein [Desulfarculales bacterium]